MNDQSYPLDAIGNRISKDDLVRVALQEAALVFTVVDVHPASTLLGADQKPMALNGTITIAVTIPVSFQGGALLSNFYVLKKPDPGPVH